MSIPRIIPCFHSYGQAPTQFALDLARAMRYSGTLIPHPIHEQSCYVEAARNKLVKHFLASEGTHMMMLDVDLSFEADAFIKTFTILEQYQADVLYGNYPLGNSGNSIFGAPENKQQESAVMVKLEPNHVYEGIVTGGTGWLMARRSVLERMLKECPGPWHWFARDLTSDGKDFRGEDISFGLRMYNMTPRPRVLGTTAVLLRHLKNQPFIMDFMQGEAKAAQVPALCFPNPYENNPQFLINGHTVIDKTSLTPDQLAQIEADLAKGGSDAVQKREAEKVPSDGPSPEAQGEENQDGDDGSAVEGLRPEAGTEQAS